MRYFGYMFLFGNICAKNLGLVDDAARCLESPVWGRPVRGNGKIVQELEGDFRGAGWNVIKLLWGKGWDELLETARGLSRGIGAFGCWRDTPHNDVHFAI